MSQALSAHTRPPATSGSSALASHPVRRGRPSPGTPQRPRTPLSVVPARPSRRRVPFAVFSCALLVAALVAVLILNISVSSTQYELVQLRGQQVALSQENEALVQRLEDRGAPQNLAAAATKLGMVSSPTFGSIDLEIGKVTGTPEPAKEGSTPEALIAAPEVVTAQGAPVPAPPAAPEAAAEPEPAPAPAEAAPVPAPADAAEGQAAEAPAAEAPAVELPEQARSAVPGQGAAPEHPTGAAGGTIPGPAQFPSSR
ncbi:hypothetical protein E2F48_15650 [Arthrobacter crusticola]|uniref:Cell division protein FtsL n=1 Tax=Arthrobacter crusticola TaxID=2547960 RepID=A0A4R5TT70_9MICC|nr:hypothetical protein [Arthrobacter crusticola]TDK24192.1 hypothetical protein E2F48_15650 [Arthrobacter crusticola]